MYYLLSVDLSDFGGLRLCIGFANDNDERPRFGNRQYGHDCTADHYGVCDSFDNRADNRGYHKIHHGVYNSSDNRTDNRGRHKSRYGAHGGEQYNNVTLHHKSHDSPYHMWTETLLQGRPSL